MLKYMVKQALSSETINTCTYCRYMYVCYRSNIILKLLLQLGEKCFLSRVSGVGLEYQSINQSGFSRNCSHRMSEYTGNKIQINSITHLHRTPPYPRESVPTRQVSLHHRFLSMGEIGHCSEKTFPDHRASSHQCPLKTGFTWRQVLLHRGCPLIRVSPEDRFTV